MTDSGFEYRNKKSETPFETFLRYTDEKERSASTLATILEKKLPTAAKILDIGTGNGEYLRLALSKIDQEIVKEVTLTLVEPSEDLVKQLKNKFLGILSPQNLIIEHSSLQNLANDSKFDIILMSHLFYHIPRDSRAAELSKAMSMLKSNGVLIIVLRGKDDAYDFKMAFKPLLLDSPFKALTLDDVLEALPQSTNINIEKYASISQLHIPAETDQEDTISIIEFYLNKEWASIPPEIQQKSLDFIKDKKNTFDQIDGIAVVLKK